jgi:putative colanic acid biosysnthesis UDP-glucose lipid carrier transferase
MTDFTKSQSFEDLGNHDGASWRRTRRSRGLSQSLPAVVVKRILDVVVSGVLLVILLPVFVVIGCALLLESGSPVFFRQRRGGLNGRPFLIMKFRTMRVLEDGANLAQATKGDARVTRVGRFLRRTSLDELPQLWNVLCGEMSLVGPRPHALAHDLKYSMLIPVYPLRQRMKPGITGLAQVGGLRGETATVEAMAGRVETDIRYVNNWTLWLDLKIFVRTAYVVLFDRNAF